MFTGQGPDHGHSTKIPGVPNDPQNAFRNECFRPAEKQSAITRSDLGYAQELAQIISTGTARKECCPRPKQGVA